LRPSNAIPLPIHADRATLAPSQRRWAQATYSQLSLDFFRQLPIPGAHLIVEMYEWYHQGCPGA